MELQRLSSQSSLWRPFSWESFSGCRIGLLWQTLTSYFVGILIALYVLFFAPVSGFSINPARTKGSAVFAQVWTAEWLYFIAPLLGMMIAAEVYLHIYRADRILCAKLHPDSKYPCPFYCRYPLHHHS